MPERKNHTSHPDQIVGILEKFDKGAIREALQKLGLGCTSRPSGPSTLPPGASSFGRPIGSLAGFGEAATFLAAQDTSGEVQDLVDKLKSYLGDPSQLVSGPRSSGSRETAVAGWKRSCRTHKSEDPATDFPLTEGKLEWYVWDHIIDGEITVHVTLTWSYDGCFIYDADYSLIVQRNDEPEDYGVVMLENYSIPQTTPVEQCICHPCTPKCLRAQASIVFYASRIGVPGVSKQIPIDVLLCPSGPEDKTNYAQSQGNGNGVRAPGSEPLAPPVKPHSTNSGTWGVSRVDRDSPDSTKKYFPRSKEDLGEK